MNNRMFIEGNQYFRVMDRDYPGSFFIYNTRSMDKWIQSRLRHAPVGGNLLEKFKYLYGTEDSEVVTRHWINQRNSFEAELHEYFEGSKRFLILNVESEDPGAQIAQFLGMELDLSAWRVVHVTKEPIQKG